MSIYYKQEGLGWVIVDEKDVPDLMASGVPLMTPDIMREEGYVNTSGYSPHLNYRGGDTYYDKEAILEVAEKKVKEFEEEHLLKKRKSSFYVYGVANGIIRERFKDMIEEDNDGSYIRLKDSVVGRKPKQLSAFHLLHSLMNKIEERTRTITNNWDLTMGFKFNEMSPYRRFQLWVIIFNDLHLRPDKELKQLTNQVIEAFKTHKWSKDTECHKDDVIKSLTVLSKMPTKKS